MGFTFTTIVIAALASYGAYSFWNKNRFAGLILATLAGIAGAFAFFALFFQAVALTFKLLPLIALGLIAWLIYRSVQNRKQAENSHAGSQYYE